MNVSVILGHPYEGSFNTAVATTACEALNELGHYVNYHDLQAEKFDPVMPQDELIKDKSADELVILHQQQIQNADGIIIVHPNWWGQPPAILKGWVDRILRENVAYRFEEGDAGGGLPIGLLKARIAVVFNTSNTPVERELTVFGDPLERIWKNCVFDFCGVKNFERKMFGVVADSSLEERSRWLQEARDIIRKLF